MYANMYSFEQEMRGTPSDRQASAQQGRQVRLARLAGRHSAARSSRPFTRLLAFSGR
jgi:hypothetical protein